MSRRVTYLHTIYKLDKLAKWDMFNFPCHSIFNGLCAMRWVSGVKTRRRKKNPTRLEKFCCQHVIHKMVQLSPDSEVGRICNHIILLESAHLCGLYLIWIRTCKCVKIAFLLKAMDLKMWYILVDSTRYELSRQTNDSTNYVWLGQGCSTLLNNVKLMLLNYSLTEGGGLESVIWVVGFVLLWSDSVNKWQIYHFIFKVDGEKDSCTSQAFRFSKETPTLGLLLQNRHIQL